MGLTDEQKLVVDRCQPAYVANQLERVAEFWKRNQWLSRKNRYGKDCVSQLAAEHIAAKQALQAASPPQSPTRSGNSQGKHPRRITHLDESR